MTNRFKGLDLIDRVPEELWTEVPNIVSEVVIKKIPKKKKCKRRKPRDTWSNRQILLWSTKGSRAKANKSFPKIKNWS